MEAGSLNYLSCKFFKVTSSGEATKIDEYVPAITPTSSTNAKSRVDSPPRKYSDARAMKIVTDVLIDLAIVCDTESPTVSVKETFVFPVFRCSRTRSNTTIVS